METWNDKSRNDGWVRWGNSLKEWTKNVVVWSVTHPDTGVPNEMPCVVKKELAAVGHKTVSGSSPLESDWAEVA